jgi:S1-C subfamily serine protease
MTRPRAPLIAMIAAGLSLAVAVVAVVIVVTRGGAPAKPAGMTVDDGEITAAEFVALGTAPLETAGSHVAIKAGTPAAAALGLRAGDGIVAIGGAAIKDEAEYAATIARIAVSAASTVLYVDIDRDGVPVVVRRRVTGDLVAAWTAAHPDPRDAVRAAWDDPVLPTDPAAPATDPDDLQAAIDAGIARVDDTHFTVSRALFDRVATTPAALAKGARIVPAIKNGKADGIKLYAIRPNSIFARLGLTNGDSLQRINGNPLTSSAEALTAYNAVKTADAVVVDLTRRGKPVTLHYTIK